MKVCLRFLMAAVCWNIASGSEDSRSNGQYEHPAKKCKVQEEIPAISSFDVAGYIVEAHLKQNRPITHLRLQKLLYYAQGYHLAANAGQPLFPNDMHAWDLGPVEPEVYHSPYKKKFRNSTITREWFEDNTNKQNTLKYHPELMHKHPGLIDLDAICDFFAPYSDQDLVDKTHTIGDPWDEIYHMKQETGVEVIPKERMFQAFTKIPQISILHKSLKKLQSIERALDSATDTHTVRTQLAEFEAIGHDESIWELIYERRCKAGDKRFHPLYKSPGQTWREAIGAYLFFLPAIDTPQDNLAILSQCEPVQAALAVAAGFKNPFACHYLQNALYNEMDEESSESLNKRGKMLLENITNDSKADHFVKAIAYLHLNRRTEAHTILMQRQKNIDDRADRFKTQLQLARIIFKTEEKGEILSKLYEHFTNKPYRVCDIGRMIAYELAEVMEEPEEAFTLYEEAGNAGAGQGYYRIALMIRRGELKRDNPEQVMEEYYHKAAKAGMPSAWEILGRRFKDQGKPEDAIKAYLNFAYAGYRMGYYKAGELLEEQGKTEEAKDAYLKSGHQFGVQDAVRLGADPEEAEKAAAAFKDYINGLYRLACKA